MATDDAEAALASLLGGNRSGDTQADLIAAAQEAMRRRERNTIDGGIVIAALVELGMSYRDIERATGIPHVTAHRWATSLNGDPLVTQMSAISRAESPARSNRVATCPNA